MKLRLLCIGRLTEDYLQTGCNEFVDRLKRYLPITVEELKEHKTGRKADLPRIIKTEGEKLLARIPGEAFVVALDERGRQLSSEQMADFLNRHMVNGTPELILVVGGPFGLSAELKQRADLVLSLSAMTLTHQMVRLLLLEQLYRGFTIMRNEPYHHR